MYAEVIFETGAKSIISYDDEAELKSFLSEHHRRAITGEPGAPQDQVVRDDIDYSDPGMVHPDRATQRPAERIHKVLTYSDHPADMYSTGVGLDTVKTLAEGMSVGGVVDHEQLIRALRDEVSPVYPVNQGNLHSIYKAQEDGELDLAFLNNIEGSE